MEALAGPTARTAEPIGPSVIVVGSINVDFAVRVPHLPVPGETVTGGKFERHGGGKGANQAVAAARSGASVCFVGAVGDDELGRWQLQELALEGIDVASVVRVPGAATGVALIVVDEATGENEIAVASGANALLGAAEVEVALATVEPAIGAVCLMGFEVPDAALLAAARWARKRALMIIVNPGPARPIHPDLLALHPILTPNEAEASALAGAALVESAGRKLHESAGAPVLVTMGATGVLLVAQGASRRLPAFPSTAVDTTGAGDVFNGALGAAMASGTAFERAVRWAMAAAALSTTRVGARSAPTAEQVEALLGLPG
jgi:ribokinase